MLFSEVETNLRKIEVETILTAIQRHVSNTEGLMAEVTGQHLAKNTKNAARITTLKPCVKVVMGTQIDMTQFGPDQRERVIKGKYFMRLLKIRTMQWTIWQIRCNHCSNMMCILMQLICKSTLN